MTAATASTCEHQARAKQKGHVASDCAEKKKAADSERKADCPRRVLCESPTFNIRSRGLPVASEAHSGCSPGQTPGAVDVFVRAAESEPAPTTPND